MKGLGSTPFFLNIIVNIVTFDDHWIEDLSTLDINAVSEVTMHLSHAIINIADVTSYGSKVTAQDIFDVFQNTKKLRTYVMIHDLTDEGVDNVDRRRFL